MNLLGLVSYGKNMVSTERFLKDILTQWIINQAKGFTRKGIVGL